jgi:hypothetical protein
MAALFCGNSLIDSYSINTSSMAALVNSSSMAALVNRSSMAALFTFSLFIFLFNVRSSLVSSYNNYFIHLILLFICFTFITVFIIYLFSLTHT